MRYADFTLVASEPQVIKADGRKRLLFKLLVPGVFDAPIAREIDMRAVGDLADRAGRDGASWDDAYAIGAALADALLPPDVRNALDQSITKAQALGEGVRVRLMLAGSELNNWPWEFLLFNRGGREAKVSDFLALMPNVSIVRHTATPLPAWRVDAKVPARLFVATASPRGKPKLDVAKERKLIGDALRDFAQLSVDGVDDAQRDMLPDAARPAHLFHFAGHGEFDTALSLTPGAYEGNASIVLDDGYGDPESFSADLLAVRLRDAGVRVAVLGACLTAERDDVNAWSSVAEALLKAEIAAVVGMQFSVRDDSALRFAKQFYRSLAIGLTIDEAVTAGRMAIVTSGDVRGWATPALYLRSPDGVIFGEIAADATLAQARVVARQDIDVLKGKATNVRIGTMRTGKIEAKSNIRIVEKGGSAVNVKIDKLTGGTVKSTQKIGKVSGEVTGVDLRELRADSFRGITRTTRAKEPAPARPRAAKPPRAADPVAATIDSRVDVGTLTGGEAIGTKIDRSTIIIQQPIASAPHVAAIEEKLRLDVALPKSAVIGDPFELLVAVKQLDAPQIDVSDSEQIVSAQGSVFRQEADDLIRYRIEVLGDGFTVKPTTYDLLLRPGTSSPTVAFQVIANRAGTQKLFVNAYQKDGALAAQTRLRIEVVVAVAPDK